MPEWFFPARRARCGHVEAAIQTMLEEAALSSSRTSLGIAAFRLQRKVAEGGVVISFEHAFYTLRKCDLAEVFAREK